MSLAIDDVGYLKQSGVTEQYLCVVDSSKRDRAAFPKPNMYEAVFNEPFPNTFSVALINAKVPRTQYLVSQTNNVLTYRYGDGVWETFVLSPGDYGITDLVAQLNASLSGLTVSVVPFQNRLLFVGDETFRFDMTLSSMRGVLGFGDPVDPADVGYTVPDAYLPGPATQLDSHDVFVSVPSPATVQAVIQGPGGVEPVGHSASVIRMAFTPAATGRVNQLRLLYTSTAALSVPFELSGGGSTASGALSVSTTSSPTYGVATLACDLLAGTEYVLSFPTTVTVVQFYVDGGTAATAAFQPRVELSTSSGWVATGGCMCLELDLVTASGTQQVAAPGLYDLTGVRYVTVECKELSSHLFRSRAYDRWTAGLGVVDLGVFGYQNQSFDYTSYPARECHPFTLRKLTLSFVCPDGSLYDFKGVDHLLTFVIRYYTPRQDVGQVGMLNRHYDPDPSRAWLTDHDRQRRREREEVRRGRLLA